MEQKPSKKTPPTPTAQRLTREAQALRENLLKRKQQARLRQTKDKDTKNARDA